MSLKKVKCYVASLLAAVCFLCTASKSQDYDHCGLRSVSMRSRIIGGIRSRPGMWPWQVAIYKGNDDGNKEKKFICGGALVDSKWVVTTAHCFFKMTEMYNRIRYEDDSTQPNKYTVVAGEYNIFQKDESEQERQVSKIHIYPGYRHAPFYDNDIALVELNKSVTTGPYVRTVCIPDPGEKASIPGAIASVAGWGRTKTSTRSPILLHSAYQIQNDNLCDQTTTYFFNRSVTLCAGNSDGGNDTCQGDSGGSLVREMLHKGAQRWVTVGLVSWGEGCGIKGKYGYYTRMEPFVPWIQRKIRPVKCDNPGNIPNGRFTGKDFSVGSRVKYRCKRGYRLRGRSRRKCKQNGRWSRAPVCQRVECQRLSNPSNGMRRPVKKRYFYGDKVRFSCRTNFTRIGKPVIVCQRDETWSGFQAVCLAPCPDPGIPKEGARLDHSFRHNDVVRFTCKQGWKLQGVRAIRCIKGRWDESLPKCTAIDCGRLPVPRHGEKIKETSTAFGGKVLFRCKRKDFVLKGSVARFCGGDGRWNGTVTACERILCKHPGKIAYGNNNGHRRFYRVGTTVNYWCFPGYSLEGGRTLECNITGRWNKPPPKCNARTCSRPEPPENAYIYSRRKLKKIFRLNDVIIFRCRGGYNGTGSGFRRCLSDGWSNSNFKCIPLNCSRLPQPPHGEIIEETSLSFGGKVIFHCKKGYELKGSAERFCVQNGNWNGTLTSCQPVKCRDPGTPENGVKRPDKKEYVFQDRIDFQCKENYTLKGDLFIACQNNKTWSGTLPRCLAGCRVPKDLVGVHSSPRVISGQIFQHSSIITFSCLNNKTNNGSKEIVCDNGIWSSSFPTCQAPCKDPGTPKDGMRYDNDFRHGKRVRFACKSGKIINGEAVIRCNNGEWDHDPPKCYGTIKTVCHTFLPWSDIFCEIK